jgi:hypothetical protein
MIAEFYAALSITKPVREERVPLSATTEQVVVTVRWAMET